MSSSLCSCFSVQQNNVYFVSSVLSYLISDPDVLDILNYLLHQCWMREHKRCCKQSSVLSTRRHDCCQEQGRERPADIHESGRSRVSVQDSEQCLVIFELIFAIFEMVYLCHDNHLHLTYTYVLPFHSLFLHNPISQTHYRYKSTFVQPHYPLLSLRR